MQLNKILIVDYGSQYTQLIARRVREIGVYCEIMAYNSNPERFQKFNPQGVILSGGPQSAHASSNVAPQIPKCIFDNNIPVLGICYGMQILAQTLGGQVASADKREFGLAKLNILEDNLLFNGIEQSDINIWMSHGDHVVKLPENFHTIAKSDNAQICAFANLSKNYYGVQFHPEVTHSEYGSLILENFVVKICKCEQNWTQKNIVSKLISELKEKIGNQKVILGLSGGVDSSVVAKLLDEAIGKNLYCVFVDTGLLRKNEKQEVIDTFKQALQAELIVVDAKDVFYEALINVTCPEEKRKIIGRTFIEIFDNQAKQFDNIQFLAQGTIYPDVIESAGNDDSTAVKIKSHHNVGGLPEKMNLKLCEPLKYLFKDEVRNIGLELGLPKDLLFRHPFPGPGLGVRILGEIKAKYVDILQQADQIFIEELKKHDLYSKTAQAFAVFLPVKSVGVMGDNRAYDYVISLRAVETSDFMTARWARLPYDFLDLVSTRIINEVKGISRVVYDISGKPPATIEWE